VVAQFKDISNSRDQLALFERLDLVVIFRVLEAHPGGS
jgi:hypothetical protein